MKKLRNVMMFLVVLLIFNSNFIGVSAKSVVPSIKLTQSKLSMFVGQSAQLKYSALNINKNPVVWSTSNSSIMTVNNGKVTALKPGQVSITVSVPKLKIKSMATITVSKKQLSAQEVFNKVNKSVVYIEVYNKYNQAVGSGSGFIVSKDGKIVTNHHVVVDVSEVSYVKVKLSNGLVYETKRAVGYNAQKDIVILKIDGPTNLPVVELGDSSKVQTGEKVYALGSPKGIQNTITEGIVSNKNVIEDKNTYIQTTAPINPGNSGGVLVNIYGEVIGINDWTYVGTQNMNYAIPINVYKQVPANSNYQLIVINRQYYIPAHGTGDVIEQEDNGTIDDADLIPYSDARIIGKFSNNQDIDYFYFLITNFEHVSIVGSSIDPKYAEDFTFALFDEQGNLIRVCDIQWHDDINRYLCELEEDLLPGFYHIGVYVDPNAKNNNTGQNYLVKMIIAE